MDDQEADRAIDSLIETQERKLREDDAQSAIYDEKRVYVIVCGMHVLGKNADALRHAVTHRGERMEFATGKGAVEWARKNVPRGTRWHVLGVEYTAFTYDAGYGTKGG